MKVYYDKDADLSLIKGKNVTIIGYGSQGHAHAQNLNDSGVKVTVGLRKGGASWSKAEKAGLKVAEIADAVKAADVVMILLPDEQIAAVYNADVHHNIKAGASLAYALPAALRAGAVVALWSRTVLFHWAMPGYLFLFPVLGAWLATWPGARRWAVGSAGLVALVLGVGVSEVRWNWLAWFRPGLDPGLQAVDLTPLRGVLAGRGLVGQAVAAPSWNDAGKVDYALGGQPGVVALTADARQFGFKARPAPGSDVLIVAPRQDEARIRGAYAGRFAAIEALAPAEVVVPGRGVVRVPLFMGRGLISWP